MRGEVEAQSALNEVNALGLAVQVMGKEAPHAQGLAVLWEALQDLVCCLDALESKLVAM